MGLPATPGGGPPTASRSSRVGGKGVGGLRDEWRRRTLLPQQEKQQRLETPGKQKETSAQVGKLWFIHDAWAGLGCNVERRRDHEEGDPVDHDTRGPVLGWPWGPGTGPAAKGAPAGVPRPASRAAGAVDRAFPYTFLS